MIIGAVILLVSALMACPLRAQTASVLPNLADRGTFEISTGGKPVGTETFEIKVHSNQIEAQAELEMEMDQNGKKVEARTTSNLVLDSKLDPVSYTWSQKGTHSSQLSVDFRSSPAQVRYKTASGQQDRRDFKLDKDVVILDDNVIDHYQLALARYDQSAGGTQGFRAFIPQEAAPGMVALKFLGPEPININGETRTLRHFVLTAEQAQVSLWADDQGHLQLVAVPDSQFQAIRKK